MIFEAVLIAAVVVTFVLVPFTIGYATGDGGITAILALFVVGSLGVIQWFGGGDLRIFGLFLIGGAVVAAAASVAGSLSKRKLRGSTLRSHRDAPR